ncbi:MAG TPA: allophanate hydrolase subunit 1 [Gemmataceae bacterium]|nr:allophanate hydrolase subunit 1 [Gemmataceae bacterium]
MSHGIHPQNAMPWTRIVPLGDLAALAYFDQESAALRFAANVRRQNCPWLIDVVQAYSSVAVFFDPTRITYGGAVAALSADDLSHGTHDEAPGRLHRVPCCYELALDLERVAEHRGLTGEEVIRLHAQTIFTIYAIGFCPGYPFLGYLPEPLCGVPRLPAPRLRVEAGTVGITGRQSGIYTEPRPGGWNLIGRTPLQLVDVADGYFPLRTGDRIQFEQIDLRTFKEMQGQRLPVS